MTTALERTHLQTAKLQGINSNLVATLVDKGMAASATDGLFVNAGKVAALETGGSNIDYVITNQNVITDITPLITGTNAASVSSASFTVKPSETIDSGDHVLLAAFLRSPFLQQCHESQYRLRLRLLLQKLQLERRDVFRRD